MKAFELQTDGKLTRAIIHEYGNHLNLKDRLRQKSFGIGQLHFKGGHDAIEELYDRLSNSIRAHFDWTTKGAIIRLRTSKNLYALGIRDCEIKSIQLIKEKDEIDPIPLLPFWFLLKIGIPIQIAKWFRIRGDKFIEGPISLCIILNDNTNLVFELKGDMWKDCLKTFRVKKIKERTFITDKRSPATNITLDPAGKTM